MIGLVVNPVAGVGGPAGLAGSDGADVQRLAFARGARSRVQERTAIALQVLAAQHPGLVVLTADGAMGADAVRAAGLVPRVVYEPRSAGTDAVPASGLVSQVVYEPRSLSEGACDRDETRDATLDSGDGRFVSLRSLNDREVLDDRGSFVDGATDTDAGDTARAVAAVAAAGADLVLVVGGDGTLRDAVSGLARSRTQVDLFTTQEESLDPGRNHPDSAVSGEILRSCEHRAAETDAGRAPAASDGGRSDGRRTVAHGLQGENADAGRNAAESSDNRESVLQTVRGRAEQQMPDIADPRMPATTSRMPAVLGVPAGVKMYSPVFAVSPSAAGSVAAEWISRGGLPTEEREVLDIDEAAMRRARVDPALYGLLRVPYRPGRTQARKAATPATEAAAVEAAARGVVALMRPGVRYLLGPGGTTAAVARRLGVEGSPLGVDVVLDGKVLRTAASERELLAEIARGPAKAVVTVIGGQGFLLGRGNQQLSASVIRALGDDPLLVVAPEQKLLDLHGRPLIVDTGDAELDAKLTGHVRIITGAGSSSLYAVTAPELVPTQ